MAIAGAVTTKWTRTTCGPGLLARNTDMPVLTAETLGRLYGVSFFELERDGHSYPLTEV